MRVPRRQSGVTLIEVLIGAVLSVFVLGAAVGMLSGATDLAVSDANDRSAKRRSDRVLWECIRDLRPAALGSLVQPDGTALTDGETTSDLAWTRVENWDGSALVGTSVRVRHDGATGEIVRTLDGREEVLARGVSRFVVHRNGDQLEIEVRASAGPGDDRSRRATALGRVKPRN